MISRLLLNPYILLPTVAVILTAGGIAWWNYRGLVTDLETAQKQLATVSRERDLALETANRNAEMVFAVEAERRRIVLELESVSDQLSAAQSRDTDVREEIARAPDADDGPVAPLLERLRSQRFGGVR